MKSERENFLKLKQEMESLGSRLVGLKGEFDALRMETSPLEHESLVAEVRGDADFLAKKKTLETAQARILAIETEIAAGQKKTVAMTEVLVELREKARVELTFEWRGIFERGLKSFIQKANEAHRAEIDLEEIRIKAITAFGEIGAACPIGPWASVVMRDRAHPSNPSELERFIEIARLANYKVD